MFFICDNGYGVLFEKSRRTYFLFEVQMVTQGRSGRSAIYGDVETYMLMEPGEDEQFVTAEELQERLKVVRQACIWLRVGVFASGQC